jgi:hypothetical protein
MDKKKTIQNKLTFHANTDLYPSSPDIDVSFYQELYKYKSVEDYLKNKNKKKKKGIKKRKLAIAMALSSDDSNYLDFPTDGIPSDYDTSGANQIGGIADHVTPPSDFYGNTYGNTLGYGIQDDLDNNNLDEDIILRAPEPAIHGMPDGINNPEDRENIYNSGGYDPNNGYNITDIGTGIYNKDHFQI